MSIEARRAQIDYIVCSVMKYLKDTTAFTFVQQKIAKMVSGFLEYPLMRTGPSFNLSALKVGLEKKMETMKSRAN